MCNLKLFFTFKLILFVNFMQLRLFYFNSIPIPSIFEYTFICEWLNSYSFVLDWFIIMNWLYPRFEVFSLEYANCVGCKFVSKTESAEQDTKSNNKQMSFSDSLSRYSLDTSHTTIQQQF